MLTVEAAGPGATIQDGGRFGLLRYGVTPSGPMDRAAFRTANLALGNDPDMAALEIAVSGIVLAADEPTTVAYAGGAFTWSRGGQQLPSAAVVLLRAGERLQARAGRWGAFCYLAVCGGFATPPVLGSRATHSRSGLGHRVTAGDRLGADGPDLLPDDAAIAAPWLARDDAPVRVVLGPQDDHFTAAGLAALVAAPFTLTPQADRMAYRFSGAEIEHCGGHDIVSDGIALGAIQVAGDRAPMVLMADRQPTGGYPKIAHVATVDIGRLAQLRPGERCRFAIVSSGEARLALLAAEQTWTDAARHLRPIRIAPSTLCLGSHNLVSGVVDGSDDRTT